VLFLFWGNTLNFSDNIFQQILKTLQQARIGFSVNDSILNEITNQNLKPEQSDGRINDTDNSNCAESDCDS